MSQKQKPYQIMKGVEKYVKNASKKEKYIKLNNHEIYAFDYSKKREIIAKDENDQEYYCKRDDNEIYPVYLDSGFHKFISVNGKQKYAVDKFGNEKYPLSRMRKEKIAKKTVNSAPIFFYATNARKEEFYPRDDLRNEWIHQENNKYLIAVDKDSDTPKAPVLRNGKVKYRVQNNRELLYSYKNKLFFGKDASGNEIYPLDENNDEYYPIEHGEPLIARDASGNLKYALNHLRKIVYPKDGSQNEQYIEYFKVLKSENCLENQTECFERYIDSNLYPLKYTHNGQLEIIINNTLLQHYPLDSDLNEYSNETGDIIESLGYPITNDNFIIVPNVGNRPRILQGDDHLLKHIKYLLYRPCLNSYDFLTDLKSTRLSKQLVTAYKKLYLSDYKIGTTYTPYYVIGGLVLLISIFLILIFC